MARHIYHCPLRWADMDSLGHVNNVVYVDYLQESRVDMLRVHAPVQGGEQLAEGVVVVRHEVEFVHPLVFRFEPVRIESWVSQIRVATFTMDYEILDVLPDGERRVYLRRTQRAHAVRLRPGAAAPDQRRRTRGARPLPRARGGDGMSVFTSTSATSGSPTSTCTATSTT